MASDPFLSDPSRKRRKSDKVTSTAKKSSRSAFHETPRNNREQEYDDEISSHDSDSEAELVSDSEEKALSSDEEFADESAADRRRRLAKQYLENIKNEELGESNDEFFDAQDIDNDIIARRLQTDVAEEKGYIYKFIGDRISSQIDDVAVKTTRIGLKNLTAIAVRYPYLYTTSKDIELIKWNISVDKRAPQRLRHTKGGFKHFELKSNPSLNHHCDQINCVAASPDGQYIVTGGNDSRLIIWSSENLACLKVLETRAPVNSIAFRRNTDQLFAACADLKVKTFSINQFCQLEVLYGHQDNISDITSLSRETCVSVGSRDKTAMFWKIAEESRLTFRGGDSSEGKRKSRKNDDAQGDTDNEPFFFEGSIDVVSMNDETHFVTGSDNGNLSLWSLSKKKPLFTHRISHGLKDRLLPKKASAESAPKIAELQIPEPQPYWITATHAIPFSDIFVTGSYNGSVKLWKIDKEGLRSFSLIGEINDVKGCVVGIESVEIPESKKLVIYVLTSKEHKFGRWLNKIDGARNALISFAFDT
ncbi:uncharacterized protein PRCAT00002232001 [Priceomyces carsonii]|uniref:uncharacterized protein n=1 Tax=Priceomyces carsonii TaxID=28549 RepID=UPI002ED7C648|nr:unnamed protein product [Priceomyces carsonii]